MKKLLSLMLAAIMLAMVLCSCKNTEDKKTGSENINDNKQVETTSDEVTTDEITTEAIVTEEVFASEQDRIKNELKNIISENYTYTDVDNIIINENLGTDVEDDYIVSVYLVWNQKNRPDTTKSVLAMYSQDFAARIGNEINNVSDFAVFWTVPYYSEEDTAVKYSYERKDNGMYQVDAMINTNILK